MYHFIQTFSWEWWKQSRYNIQHNNEHDDEEFVLGPQCLEATQPLVQLDCFCQLECHHHCCQLKFYMIGTTSTGDPSNSLTWHCLFTEIPILVWIFIGCISKTPRVCGVVFLATTSDWLFISRNFMHNIPGENASLTFGRRERFDDPWENQDFSECPLFAHAQQR